MKITTRDTARTEKIDDVANHRGIVITPDPLADIAPMLRNAAEGSTRWETQVMTGKYAPRIWVDLDSDVMANQRETICTATVKFPDGKSAVVHFDVHVNDNGKVEARVTAGHATRDVVRAVNVPAWNRRHV